VYSLYDNNVYAAYAITMKVFHDATMAAMDEAGEAFDAAYAASMKATELLEQKSKSTDQVILAEPIGRTHSQVGGAR